MRNGAAFGGIFFIRRGVFRWKTGIDIIFGRWYNEEAGFVFRKILNGGREMTIIVTGGAGFIGGDFIEYTLERYPKDRVVCVDKLTYAGGMPEVNDLSSPNFSFVRADICNRERMAALFRQETPNVVINFAAESHVDRSIVDSSAFFQTNVLGTAVLLDMGRTFGVKRFHQVSTDEVYGSLSLTEKAWTESEPLSPRNPYAASKASADLIALSYANTYGMPVTISRCCNNYGPRQFPEKLIPLAAARLLTGGKIPVYGTGEQRRNWIYVRDHVRAIDRIVRQGKAGEVYNIGSDSERTNIDLAKEICRELNVSTDRIESVADRKGHDFRYAVDCEKIKALGWRAETEFSDGLKNTLDWYRTHESWWKERI